MVTRVRSDLSHLRVQQYRQSFQDTLDPTCSCGFNRESIVSLFSPLSLVSCWTVYSSERLKKNDITILNKGESVVIHIQLYGEESFKGKVNFLILNASVDFVLLWPMRIEILDIMNLKFILLSVRVTFQPVNILKIPCSDFLTTVNYY